MGFYRNIHSCLIIIYYTYAITLGGAGISKVKKGGGTTIQTFENYFRATGGVKPYYYVVLGGQTFIG